MTSESRPKGDRKKVMETSGREYHSGSTGCAKALRSKRPAVAGKQQKAGVARVREERAGDRLERHHGEKLGCPDGFCVLTRPHIGFNLNFCLPC